MQKIQSRGGWGGGRVLRERNASISFFCLTLFPLPSASLFSECNICPFLLLLFLLLFMSVVLSFESQAGNVSANGCVSDPWRQISGVNFIVEMGFRMFLQSSWCIVRRLRSARDSAGSRRPRKCHACLCFCLCNRSRTRRGFQKSSLYERCRRQV